MMLMLPVYTMPDVYFMQSDIGGIGVYFPFNLVALAVFSYVNICIHELGHVVAAIVSGLGVSKVMIGNGQEVKRFYLFGVPLVITNNLNGGFTYPARLKSRFLKLRLFIFSAGGITMQLLITSLYIGIFGFEPREFLGSSGVALSSAFVISNIIIVLLNLMPVAVDIEGTKVPNDGLRLAIVPFLKKEEVQELLASGPSDKSD